MKKPNDRLHRKVSLIGCLLLLFCSLGSTGWCGRIIYPWRATTAIVKAGESFDVWFAADAGQTVTNVALTGPYCNVSPTMGSPVTGSWVYDPVSGSNYNTRITLTVPTNAPGDRYDLVLNTSSGSVTSKSSVKIVQEFKDNYYIMHISDSHMYQGTLADKLVVPDRRNLLMKIANILDVEILVETGDLLYGANIASQLDEYFNGPGSYIGPNDISGAVFLTPGDHDAPYNDFENTNNTPQKNAAYWNNIYGLQNSSFKYGNGRFMMMNNVWGTATYQTGPAISWLGEAGSGGNFFVTAGHCYNRMHTTIHAVEPLDLVLAGDLHNIRNYNPFELDGEPKDANGDYIIPDGSAPEVAYIAGSVGYHFEYNLFRVDNSAGTFSKPSGSTSVTLALASGNEDTPATWVPALELGYSATNNGTLTENSAVFSNRYSFPVYGAKARFVMPLGSSYEVSSGTILQAFDGSAFHIVDVSVDLATNSTTVVNIYPSGSTTNNAQFVSQSVTNIMNPGLTYPVSITMTNTGLDTWTTAAGHTLGSYNSQNNTNWGFSRVALPHSVAPNEAVTFTFNMTAPSVRGVYNFQWRMTDDIVPNSGWFGQITSNVVVTVGAQDMHIEAENFTTNVGFQTQVTTDVGGGLHTAFASPGDYLTYTINVTHPGVYNAYFRLTSISAGSKFDLKIGDTILCSVNEPPTGDLAVWATSPAYRITLPQGPVTLTVLSGGSSWNMNWFEFIPIGNVPPDFTSSPGQFVEADSPYTYTVTTSDYEGDPVALSGVTVPAWLSFNTSSGVLNGTPASGDIGVHPVILRASDTNSYSDQSFTITVSAVGNDTPVITSVPNTGVIESNVYSYTVNATDADGDSLTHSAPVKPAWLGFNAGTRVLSGTPTSANVGMHPVALTVSDGSVSVTQQFNVVVFATPAPANLVQNGSFETGGAAPTSWILGGTAVGSTNSAQSGINSLRITPPTLGSRAEQTIPLEIGKSYRISVWITTIGVAGASAVFDTSDQYDATCQFLVTGSKSWTNYTGVFTATNTSVKLRTFSSSTNFTGTAYFDNVVLAPTSASNNAPVITSVAITNATQNAAYSYRLLAADVENNSITFTGLNVPAWLSFNTNSGVLSGIPDSGDVGAHPVALRVSDGSLSVTQNFTIAVGSAGISGYDAWAATNEVGTADADDDLDGRSNFYEYALNGDPNAVADTGTEPTFVKAEEGFDYTHLQRNDDPSLIYTVEVSTNLLSGVWTNGAFAAQTNGTGAAYDAVTHRIPMDEPKSYIRLKITNQ